MRNNFYVFALVIVLVMPSVSFGLSNTFYGTSAGGLITTGDYNSGFGVEALASATSSSRSTAIGFRSFYNSSGDDNTGLGYGTMLLSTVGVGNTAVGYVAGGNNGVNGQSIIDDYMTFLGFASGRANTVASTTKLVQGTAIGNRAMVGCSHCLVLGGTGTYYANVGIGTTTPYTTLDVVGTTTVDRVCFRDGTCLTTASVVSSTSMPSCFGGSGSATTSTSTAPRYCPWMTSDGVVIGGLLFLILVVLFWSLIWKS